ncbi:DUF7288 family protein [Halorussus salinisoli]|uniref:DUF7288 family protein n=1 Tax=Halorussus salinisoli TaxID=2558242 RepID=UPI0010C1FDFA|nr:hypothetical protein [Halorussus salinisoli]
MSDDSSRGQVHTLEAFTAALLVVSGVLFALQTTAVTPLTASTSNQHIENQHRTAAADLLATAAENRTLRPAVTFWDPAEGSFDDATGRGFYANGGPPNAFGSALNQTFGNLSSTGRRIAYNVYVRYRTPGNSTRRQTMVYMGSPSDNAAAATRTVALYDDTPLSAGDGNVSSANFYAPDAAQNASLYNVMEVRIVVWQM